MTQKIKSIDYLRGIAVFLMLWGHCIQYCCDGQFDFFENWAFKFIYSFHMPLFMSISGYLFFFSGINRTAGELLDYKVKRILYPILMGTTLNHILTKGILVWRDGWYSLMGEEITQLWFLWSVLACCVAVTLAVKITDSRCINVLLLIVGFVFVGLFPCWEMNMYMYPFFVGGYLYAKYKLHIEKYYSIVVCMCSVIFTVMLFNFSKEHYIYTTGLLGAANKKEILLIDIFRWIIGLVGVATVCSACMAIYNRCHNKFIIVFFEKMGKNSLAIYALSVSMLSFWLPKIVSITLSCYPKINWNEYIVFYNLVFTVIIAMFYSYALLFVIKTMKKFKVYDIVFGR